MRGFLAVARREIVERRQVLYAAAVTSLVPLAVAAIRGLAGTDAAQLRTSIAFLAAAAFYLGIAAALGVSLIVPRIASRRIAFDLSRPVSETAIWAAGVAAATVLAVSSAVIATLPTWLAGSTAVLGDLSEEPLPAWLWLVAGLLGVPAIFAFFHFVALAFRSRSGWLAFDAASIALVGVGLAAALSRLPSFLAPRPASHVAVGFVIASVVGLHWAGRQSVVRGRTDVVRAHRAASERLWPVLGAAVVLANAYAIWVMAAGPSAVVSRGFWFRPADMGPWVEISGNAREASAELLYDTATGRFERTRTVDWRGPVLSGNGRRAAWVEASDRGGPKRLRTRALDDANVGSVATRLLFEGYPTLLELSEDGSRLATWENGVLAVHDLVSERTLASARVVRGEHEELRGLFVAPEVFRLYLVGDRAIEIMQIDARTRKLEHLGEIEGGAGLYFVTNASGSRLLEVGPGIRLYDGATGALLATLADEANRPLWPRMLPDGRIVMPDAARRLRIFDADGREERTIELPPDCSGGPSVSKVLVGGEVAPDRLVVGCGDDFAKRTIWLADLREGSIRKVAEGLTPAWALGARPALGSDATKLFYGADVRSLVRFDPVTGQRREILGARH